MEHEYRCKQCGHKESWTTKRAAEAAAVWHIYQQHYPIWVRIAGKRPPKDPRPETLGRQFEKWESQL
jgi:hypothetical protein